MLKDSLPPGETSKDPIETRLTPFISIDLDTGHVVVGERAKGTAIEVNAVGEYVIYFNTIKEAKRAQRKIKRRPYLAEKYTKIQ